MSEKWRQKNENGRADQNKGLDKVVSHFLALANARAFGLSFPSRRLDLVYGE
jgi:hypothetical protein